MPQPKDRTFIIGLSQITDERVYQIEKGWTPDHDREAHPDRSLAHGALALLEPHIKPLTHEKARWIQQIRQRHQDDYEACLRIAGALIAAELSRISDPEE
jgi:hypothetical protein